MKKFLFGKIGNFENLKQGFPGKLFSAFPDVTGRPTQAESENFFANDFCKSLCSRKGFDSAFDWHFYFRQISTIVSRDVFFSFCFHIESASTRPQLITFYRLLWFLSVTTSLRRNAPPQHRVFWHGPVRERKDEADAGKTAQLKETDA